MGDLVKINALDYEAKELFKIIREWSELTQEEFAKKINVSKGTVQIMNKEREIIHLKV